MKRTVNVNLAGMPFVIDEDAYQTLSEYLSSLRRHFAETDGVAEIIADIELRLAEIFTAEKHTIVTMLMVEAAIERIGKPEDIEPANEGESVASDDEVVGRRFYRHPEDRVLGGVCGGIGAYFGMDPIWFRLAFIVSVFFLGGGVLIYIILWLVMPEVKTRNERLRMEGKRVNVGNIREAVEREIGKVKSHLEDFEHDARHAHRRYRPRAKTMVGRLLQDITDGSRKHAPLAKRLLGIAIIAAAVCMVLVLVAFIGFEFSSSAVQVVGLKTILDSRLHEVILRASIIVILAIPALAILFRIFRRSVGIRQGGRFFGILFFLTWFTGVLGVVYCCVWLAKDFSQTGYHQPEPIRLDINARSIAIRAFEHDIFPADDLVEIDFDDAVLTSSGVTGHDIHVEVQHSETDSAVVVYQRFRAAGSSPEEAGLRARKIEHAIDVSDSTLSVQPWFGTGGEPWRRQRIDIVVRLPKGMEADLDPRLNRPHHRKHRHWQVRGSH